MTKKEKEILQTITTKWQFFLTNKENIINSNMLWQMSASYQNCYDLIWLIETLNKKK